jgi:hypothetical protein
VTEDLTDAIDHDVLLVFEDLGKESLDLHSFFEMLGANTPEAQGELLAILDRLVKRGLLVERGNDFYALTVAGREAAKRSHPA